MSAQAASSNLKTDLFTLASGQLLVLLALLLAYNTGHLPNHHGVTFIGLLCVSIPFYKKYRYDYGDVSEGFLRFLASPLSKVAFFSALFPLLATLVLSLFFNVPQ